MKTILPLQLLVAPDHNDPAPLILYHGRNCPDGFGAALAAWRYYGDAAEFRGLDHGEIQSVDDLPALQGRAVYILDFSFPAEILRAIDERAAKLVMLDHHKSAAEKLTGFACRCGVVHFDMDKSGARLAWEFFHPGQPVPALLQYIEDRDIWKWAFPESASFLSALDMEPQTFARWQEIVAFTPDQLTAFMARGVAMDEKYRKLATDLAEGAQPLVFNGIEGLMVNAPGMFHSLVGDLLSAKTGTFALMWSAGTQGV
ncbi:MAG TPA: phosphoesterase, partial [Acidovorax sp.]|nr:phosphoesterase [Acidovorax sp.]